MNETIPGGGELIAAIELLKPCDDISRGLELRPSRPRRRSAKKIEPSGVVPRITADEGEVSMQTVGANSAPISAFKRVIRMAITSAHQVWRWLQTRREWQLKSRRLRLCETVSLGEKRFVAIVRVDDHQFLLGGASSSVCMLAQLNRPGDFSSVLQQRRKKSETGA